MIMKVNWVSAVPTSCIVCGRGFLTAQDSWQSKPLVTRSYCSNECFRKDCEQNIEPSVEE